METVIGVMGGSGVYNIDGLEGAEWRNVDSPFGAPSDALLFGHLNGVKMVFLPRHGRGHTLSPSTVNYRANIDALKTCRRNRRDLGFRLWVVSRRNGARGFCDCRPVH